MISLLHLRVRLYCRKDKFKNRRWFFARWNPAGKSRNRQSGLSKVGIVPNYASTNPTKYTFCMTKNTFLAQRTVHGISARNTSPYLQSYAQKLNLCDYKCSKPNFAQPVRRYLEQSAILFNIVDRGNLHHLLLEAQEAVEVTNVVNKEEHRVCKSILAELRA